MPSNTHILLTGATGYIGGRFFRILKENGFHISCMVREWENFKHLEEANGKIVYGDALDRESLKDVFTGVDTAFYLIHSLGSKKGFIEQDQIAA